MSNTFVEMISKRLSFESLAAMLLLLATAFVCAGVAYWKNGGERSPREFLTFMFPRDVLTTASAKADFAFWLTKRLMTPFLFIPAGAVFVSAVAYCTRFVGQAVLGIHDPIVPGPPGPATIVVFTVTMLVAYDISYYLYHVAQHRIPFLWELHKVHHSAEVMVGITKDRVHPLDELMNRAWDGLIPGLCFGIWTLIALDPVEVTIFGINVYVMRNILMMDFVRHTHLRISFGSINHVVLCPHWHQLHHSTNPKHYDKNFGLLFSFWDRLFGTQCIPEPEEAFTFGLIDRDVDAYQSLFGLYLLPLKKMGGHIASSFVARNTRPNDKVLP
ncbi:sterol desaturase family protein [Beijerinckia sp. L45]|uniref:sterol desaturase family protein n=1 Tax=Beijerinckia sp. L45 TaxID=1641855 RepID=UPI00131DCAC3|nr:sterol desaturase family protein [Beijerinckia sp. L45]